MTPVAVYSPALVWGQLHPPPPAAAYRQRKALLPMLIEQAEHEAWTLGHVLIIDRLDKYEAVGWCDVCGWAATVDTRPGLDDGVFDGSALTYACPGRKESPPWT